MLKVLGQCHRYWEIDDSNKVNLSQKIPYRIELVGVTCDTGLAVARGIWRENQNGPQCASPLPAQKPPLVCREILSPLQTQLTQLLCTILVRHSMTPIKAQNLNVELDSQPCRPMVVILSSKQSLEEMVRVKTNVL